MFLTALLLFLATLYFAIGVFLWGGTLRLRKGRSRAKPRVTALVAVRDEIQCIRPCLEALLRQTYPRELYEVVVVDDGSQDGTWEVLRDYAERYPNLKVLRSWSPSGELTGKQQALALGIRASSGDVILSTDADCVVPPTWAEEVSRYFSEDVGMVLGYALPPRAGKGLGVFRALETADLLFLQTVAAGCVGWKRPLSAIGKNIAYRREAYEDVGGFEGMGLQPNEDMALAQRIGNSHWRVIFMREGPVVEIRRPPSLRRFWTQRVRWASAGAFSTPLMFGLNFLAFCTHLLLALSVVVWGSYLFGMLAMYSGILVGAAHLLLLAQGGTFSRRYEVVWALPLFSPFFVLYTIGVGLVVLTPGRKIKWRGRKY
ncbi:MAG: hypothetical protein DRP95_00880 [Candidatus Latescibacterota bacterium]|nr:MAG: hypothetical protein DRP95_00880 [Candidatus Latescibacterota bacterium]